MMSLLPRRITGKKKSEELNHEDALCMSRLDTTGKRANLKGKIQYSALILV